MLGLFSNNNHLTLLVLWPQSRRLRLEMRLFTKLCNNPLKYTQNVFKISP